MRRFGGMPSKHSDSHHGISPVSPTNQPCNPQVTAQTPDFAVGSKDSIRLKPKAAAAAVNVQAAAASKPANAWLSGDDLEGEELLDDEELLTEEDRQRPVGGCQHMA